MSGVLGHDARELLAAPFSLDSDRRQISDAVWLYLYVLANGMRTGHLYRTREHLGRDLGIDDATLDQWLAALRMTDLVRVQASGDYLVLKPRLWPGNQDSTDIQTQVSSASEPPQAVQNTVPVGSSMQQASKAGKASEASRAGMQGVDRGSGEGEGLLAEAQSMLAVTDLDGLRELVDKHSAAHVRDALARVARTPPTHIRKSRFALFRYLLAQSPHPHPHDPNPPHQP